jgi:hypothetical protein
MALTLSTKRDEISTNIHPAERIMGDRILNRTFAALIAVWLMAAPGFTAQFNSSWTPKPLVDNNPAPK